MYSWTLLAALLGVAQATTVHVVSVGMNPQSNKTSLAYFPNKITAAVGDMVQFHFLAGAHTVTQSNFDNACVPIGNINPATPGFFSGAMNVAASKASGMVPVYTMMINSTTPIWVYCTTGNHCSSGMSMVINENTGANSTRSLENYQLQAKSFTGPSPQPGAGSGSEGSGSPPASYTPPTEPATPSSPSSGSNPGGESGSSGGSGSSGESGSSGGSGGFATSVIAPPGASSTEGASAPGSTPVKAAGAVLSAPLSALAAAVGFALLSL